MRIAWLWPFIGGMAGMPVGSATGVAIAYVTLMLLGETEHGGPRGLLAGVFGIVPGAILGFMAGFQCVLWATSRFSEWRSFAAGVASGLLFAITLAIAGLIGGIHCAEARGVSNYAGERAAWGLFYVALPAGSAGGIAGFLVGRWLAGG